MIREGTHKQVRGGEGLLYRQQKSISSFHFRPVVCLFSSRRPLRLYSLKGSFVWVATSIPFHRCTGNEFLDGFHLAIRYFHPRDGKFFFFFSQMCSFSFLKDMNECLKLSDEGRKSWGENLGRKICSQVLKLLYSPVDPWSRLLMAIRFEALRRNRRVG